MFTFKRGFIWGKFTVEERAVLEAEMLHRGIKQWLVVNEIKDNEVPNLNPGRFNRFASIMVREDVFNKWEKIFDPMVKRATEGKIILVIVCRCKDSAKHIVNNGRKETRQGVVYIDSELKSICGVSKDIK